VTGRLAAVLTLLLLAASGAVHAQPAAKRHVIGILTPTFDALSLSSGLPGWLEELGYREGTNVKYEKRTAAGADRLPDLAAELARLQVDVIVTSGTLATRAAKRATARVPIVMAVEDDPVALGLVPTLARPGGNVTGLTTLGVALSGKRLELLKLAVPRVTRVCVLWNPANPDKVEELKQARDAANTLRLDLQTVEVRPPGEMPRPAGTIGQRLLDQQEHDHGSCRQAPTPCHVSQPVLHRSWRREWAHVVRAGSHRTASRSCRLCGPHPEG
jgi:putative ABC transport system substrate-binding protein